MLDIVLADDESSVVESLTRRLESVGHYVRPAVNGDEALAHVRERVPDLVITDVIMPQREGIETITELRGQHPDVKLIAISGGGKIGGFSYLKAAADLGADAVLAKPFTTDQLLDVMASLGFQARSQRHG